MSEQSTALLPLHEPPDFQWIKPETVYSPYESTAKHIITPTHTIPDKIFEITVEYFIKQIAVQYLETRVLSVIEEYKKELTAKDVQIRELSNELSEFKKERHQLNSELEQIQAECKKGIHEIPEVQQALCEYNQREILFIFVLDDMTRGLSDRLGEVEYGLRDKYTDWVIGFEYVEDRIPSEQFEESQVEIFERD